MHQRTVHKSHSCRKKGPAQDDQKESPLSHQIVPALALGIDQYTDHTVCTAPETVCYLLPMEVLDSGYSGPPALVQGRNAGKKPALPTISTVRHLFSVYLTRLNQKPVCLKILTQNTLFK